jgi:hypothetical protein
MTLQCPFPVSNSVVGRRSLRLDSMQESRVHAAQCKFCLMIALCSLSARLEHHLPAASYRDQPCGLVQPHSFYHLLSSKYTAKTFYRSNRSVCVVPVEWLISAALRTPWRTLGLGSNVAVSARLVVPRSEVVPRRMFNRMPQQTQLAPPFAPAAAAVAGVRVG